MHRRLYFVLPSVETARQTADDLLLARIEHRRMHFLARQGTDLQELNEASPVQKSDLVHGAELGLVVGGGLGLVVGLFLMVAAPASLATSPTMTLLISLLVGGLFGAWASSMIGVSVPNTRLRAFSDDVAAGRVLLMLDVPPGRVEEVRSLVQRRHPECDRGMEPAIPAFP